MRPLWRRIRPAFVRVRDAVHGLLHPFRRSRARDRIAALQPSSVLFVCLGNVCRSPYGARYWISRDESARRVDSVGFIGAGRGPPDQAIATAIERGIDHRDHVSKLATPEILEQFDAIFIFDRFNARDVRESRASTDHKTFWLGDFDPRWEGKRAIIDPWGRDRESFRQVFARIERCVDEVREILAP